MDPISRPIKGAAHPDNYIEVARTAIRTAPKDSISFQRLSILLRVRQSVLKEAIRRQGPLDENHPRVSKERALGLVELFRPVEKSPPQELAAAKSPAVIYNPDKLPTLAQCEPNRLIDFNGRFGIVRSHILSDPFRPQIRVLFPESDSGDKETLNLLVRKD